ncbi:MULTISPECIES: GNAT family N-acetyltransferase [Asticcacaulis]|uniref:GNAT family N-acetyltransferase n=1 Tax=Asticcacaulis TaxID=76890 RepID=UPI001AE7D8B6|nr:MULTISPECIES: GNAT family N-acetyltransferase [Asticcacaulis]MBP2161249.1 GNAT superfamily N-acetyltransferase [Asticcacaulis solisilvae]MDR6802385.1 GNAT superfamily N-acetyltransferase [Asticcacaulis sp. BE141]
MAETAGHFIVGPQAVVSVGDVAHLLPDFGAKYPGGWSWLEKKLASTHSDSTNLWLLVDDAKIFALAIESLKQVRTRKLSTFVVASDRRGIGYGRCLLRHLQDEWCRRDVEQVHVTIDETDLATQSFFVRNHFTVDRGACVRYGARRLDTVFRWSRQTQPSNDFAVPADTVR